MLLYGVNAVGKSSVMKAVGIAVLMAQAGMYVACDSMEFSPFLGVYTRIGLRDDIRRGHSTFVVEMMELRAILKRAQGPMHLVLGDELCAGTESQSALSIVGASVRELAKRHVPFIMATHLHELSSLSDIVDAAGVGAMHLSVEFTEDDGLVFERKLRAGTGPSAYGLEVCRSLDMDPDFMMTAERIRRSLLNGHGGLVSSKKSRYNSNVIVDACGICGGQAQETHHLVPQKIAPKHIKNKTSNLLPLCSQCHDKIHDGKINVDGFRLTSKGVRLAFTKY